MTVKISVHHTEHLEENASKITRSITDQLYN